MRLRAARNDGATRAASSRGDEDMRGFKQSAKRRGSKADGENAFESQLIRRPISKTKRVTPTTINTEPTAPQTLVRFGSWNTCRTNSDIAVMKMPFMTQSVADHCVSQLRH